jgi:hypothetical protein
MTDQTAPWDGSPYDGFPHREYCDGMNGEPVGFNFLYCANDDTLDIYCQDCGATIRARKPHLR